MLYIIGMFFLRPIIAEHNFFLFSFSTLFTPAEEGATGENRVHGVHTVQLPT
jgi:hypothetical protein